MTSAWHFQAALRDQSGMLEAIGVLRLEKTLLQVGLEQ